MLLMVSKIAFNLLFQASFNVLMLKVGVTNSLKTQWKVFFKRRFESYQVKKCLIKILIYFLQNIAETRDKISI